MRSSSLMAVSSVTLLSSSLPVCDEYLPAHEEVTHEEGATVLAGRAATAVLLLLRLPPARPPCRRRCAAAAAAAAG